MTNLRTLVPLVGVLALSLSCTSSNDATPTQAIGSASILLTDATSNGIETFELDVEDIQLQRLLGSTVSLLSEKTRVDFAELESVAELIAGRGVPIGTYTGLTMTLDFSNASVYLQGKTTPATILDENGAMLTGDLDVQVSFASAGRPEIAVNRHHVFVLDLDLAQGAAVDETNNEITFVPVLSAEVDPTNPKPVAIRGKLISVDASALQVTVEKRAIGGAVIGTTVVQATPTTVYQVDGTILAGAAGLSAMAPLASGEPPIYVQGTMDTTTTELTAAAMETGYGVRGNGQDWLCGHIVARDNSAGSAATLTVIGRSFDESVGPLRFNTSHTVRVDPSTTKVLRRGTANSLDADALNVGQKIVAFGAFDTGTANLEASLSTSVVRMVPTNVYGVAAAAPSGGSLTLNVLRIGLRDISLFDFDVNGTVQADPSALTTDVSGVSIAGVTTGTKIRNIGWFSPVDVAGDEDMRTLSFVNHTQGGSLLLCQWLPASLGTITTSATEITLTDISTAPIKAVGDGFGPVALTSTPAPTIAPAFGIGIYRIVEGTEVEIHFTFATFVDALDARLTSASPFRISSLGAYDATAQQHSTLIMTVVLL